jgi:hypothetical protein
VISNEGKTYGAGGLELVERRSHVVCGVKDEMWIGELLVYKQRLLVIAAR